MRPPEQYNCARANFIVQDFIYLVNPFVHVYFENGITNINLSKQLDVINARTSRTIHPKTIELLRKLLKRFNPSFDIKVPYPDKTKADILHIFESFGETNLIASSVSCSSTRNKPKTEAAHCGCCSQCIDRIFSMFAAGLNEYDAVDALLRKGIPITFKREKPKDENDFNNKVQALLRTEDEFTREYPSLIFGETVYRADRAKDKLIIESKFIRKGTTPSKASEGIAADITKIPNDDTVAGILFVIYDPNRAITDDRRYISDFEKARENCFVRIYR